MQSVSKLTKELQRVFEVHQLWRTETEMRFSVLNDVSFPTPASKYWQCIREQNTFWEQLVQLSCEYQKTQGELELAEVEYDEIKGNSKRHNAQRKIKDSEIKQKQFGLMQMRLQAHDRVREIKIWNRIKSEIRQTNPNMIINDPNSHQENSFALRWAKQMKVGAETNDAAVYRNSKASLDTLRRNQNG